MKVKGIFDVNMLPQDSSTEGQDGIQLGRFSLDKAFHGALEASSKGDMLTARTTVNNSAGYVAIEQVTGTLEGKNGSFVLQHFGIMNKGEDKLILEIVPDSGSDELRTISGSMTIDVVDGKHVYELDYELN